jgi:hypothetical protein
LKNVSFGILIDLYTDNVFQTYLEHASNIQRINGNYAACLFAASQRVLHGLSLKDSQRVTDRSKETDAGNRAPGNVPVISVCIPVDMVHQEHESQFQRDQGIVAICAENVE